MIRKRIFDIFFSILGLILLSPLLLVVSIFIKIDSKGSIFFKQLRVGQGGKQFFTYKFRTMVQDAEKRGARLTSAKDSRITTAGKILRKYKIDELPQLINVLKGEMSFVGPRPELPEYVDLFREEYEIILRVKPGITDIASIKYLDESELMKDDDSAEKVYVNDILPQKIELYKRYVEKRSLSLDLYLIILTLFSLGKKKVY